LFSLQDNLDIILFMLCMWQF